MSIDHCVKVFKKSWGHLYSEADIMLKYKTTEKGWFSKERHVTCRPCLGCQKQQKIKKKGVLFFF